MTDDHQSPPNAIRLRRVVDVFSWAHVRELTGWREERIKELADSAGRYYSPFDLRAVGKSKWRHIENPQGELRQLQASIQRGILRHVPIPDYVVGGVPGKSIYHNATIHTRNRVVVTIDLRDCFPSIDHHRVYEAFWCTLRYAPAIARAFTKLTTYHRHVPQGAPTSTMVANLALLPLHESLYEFAEERGLSFSAWIDDLTFSGRNADRWIPQILETIREHGYAVSPRKIKVMRGWREPEMVTGTVVNTTVSAGQRRIGEIYSQIIDLASRDDTATSEIRAVWSKIAFVRQLRPTQAMRLARLAECVLPRAGIAGRPARSFETRPCRSSRRHFLRESPGA